MSSWVARVADVRGVASRSSVTLALLIGFLAVGVRYSALARGGGWSGTGPYDDGVYFMAALNFVQGALPYRDFVLVHPPGIVMLLAPFAALAPLVGESAAFHAARAAWVLIGGVNAVLCWAVLRPFGLVTALSAALLYSMFSSAIMVEYTPMLETVPNTLLLVALLLSALIRSDRKSLGGPRAVVVGVIIGLSPAIKIWGVAVVLALVLGAAYRFGWRPASYMLGAAVGSCAAICLPFFLAAPSAMWRMVVQAQIERPASTRPFAERVNDVLGLRFWPSEDHLTALTWVVLLLLLVCLAACTQRRHLRPLVGIAAVTITVLLVSPTYFPAYAALTAVPIVLSFVLGLWVLRAWSARVGTWSSRGRAAVAVTILLASAVPLVRGTVTLGGNPFPTLWAAAVIAPVPGCVTSDLPLALIEMDVVRRNVQRGCRIDADVGGARLAQPWGPSADDWGAYFMDYLGSGQAALPVRSANLSQLSTSDRGEIDRWRVISRLGPYAIRYPAPRG